MDRVSVAKGHKMNEIFLKRSPALCAGIFTGVVTEQFLSRIEQLKKQMEG